MSAPRAQLNNIVNLAGHIIGAAKLANGTYDDNPSRYDKNAAILATRMIDREIASYIARTEGHPEQFDMLTDSGNLPNGAKLPESLAGYYAVRVDGVKAAESSIYEINRIRTAELVDADDLEEEQYYKIAGDRIYHTGAFAIVGFVEADDGLGSDLLSPAAYENLILAGVLRIMFSKDGEDPSMSSSYASEYNSKIAWIRDDANLGIIREFPPVKGQE